VAALNTSFGAAGWVRGGAQAEGKHAVTLALPVADFPQQRTFLDHTFPNTANGCGGVTGKAGPFRWQNSLCHREPVAKNDMDYAAFHN
jgi:hypothetical protein